MSTSDGNGIPKNGAAPPTSSPREGQPAGVCPVHGTNCGSHTLSTEDAAKLATAIQQAAILEVEKLQGSPADALAALTQLCSTLAISLGIDPAAYVAVQVLAYAASQKRLEGVRELLQRGREEGAN